MKYRKKPVVIEAFMYGIEPRPDWFNDKVTSNDIITYVGTDIRDSSEYYCEIKTLEGVMRGNCRDYIIKGVQGEIYPCKADIFEMTYELASTSSQTISDEEIEKIPLEDALNFTEWMSSLINSNYKSGGNWYLKGEIVTTIELYNKWHKEQLKSKQ
tara:strand:+ start:433 stop:900 length:468 start_codon:yes stop_codon:yes gene_type:complete